MENNEKQPIKWSDLGLVFAGVSLFAFGIHKLFENSKAKVNPSFLDKFNEIQSLVLDTKDNIVHLTGDTFSEVGVKERHKDYKGIASTLKNTIDRLDEFTAKINNLNLRISEFISIIELIDNQVVKSDSLNFIYIVSQIDITLNKLNEDVMDLIKLALRYYESLDGDEPLLLDEDKVSLLQNRIQKYIGDFETLADRLNPIDKDLSKKIGLHFKSLK